MRFLACMAIVTLATVLNAQAGGWVPGGGAGGGGTGSPGGGLPGGGTLPGGGGGPSLADFTIWHLGANSPAAGDVQPGAMRHVCMQVTITRDPAATSPIEVAYLPVYQVGTMSGAYVDGAELWHDSNGDGVIDSGDILLAQTQVTVFNAAQLGPIQPGQSAHLLVAIDVSPYTPIGDTIKLHIPELAISFASPTSVACPAGGIYAQAQTVALPPVPQMEVSDSTGLFASGSVAAGDRDFGQLDVSSLPSAWATITIANPGSADLQLGTPVLTGADAASFVLDVSAYSGLVTPGSSTTFGVAFDAATLGARLATVEFSNNMGANFTFEVAGTATSASFPVITPAILPPATTNNTYAPFQLTVSGGVPGYTFSVAGGALPAGMQLSPSGEISGTPTAAGVYQFTALVADSVGASNPQVFNLDVIDGSTAGGAGAGAGCAVGGAAPLFAMLGLLGFAFRRRARANLA